MTKRQERLRKTSLSVSLTKIQTIQIFSHNITHNLAKMAEQAGIYEYLWRPDKLFITNASQLIEPLAAGLEKLQSDPAKFKALSPDDGTDNGTYEDLVEFVACYLHACHTHQGAIVSALR